MKIIVHDYAGHPFQIQLSRKLAERGHEVLHLYCASTHTPRGELQRRPNDPPNYQIRAIELAAMIPKNNFIRRYFLEVDYAKRLVAEIQNSGAEVILSGNTPSIPQERLARWCRANGVRLVSWVQDVYGLAAYRMLRNKLPVVGQLVGKYFIALDKRAFRNSHAIVVISEDFTDILVSWGVDPGRIHTVHNWAPLDSMPQRPRENDWSRAQQLTDQLRFIYSGTLSMRHNPALLLELARVLQQKSLGQLVVVSEGPASNGSPPKPPSKTSPRSSASRFSPSSRCRMSLAAPTCWWPSSNPTPASSAFPPRCSAISAPAEPSSSRSLSKTSSPAS